MLSQCLSSRQLFRLVCLPLISLSDPVRLVGALCLLISFIEYLSFQGAPDRIVVGHNDLQSSLIEALFETNPGYFERQKLQVRPYSFFPVWFGKASVCAPIECRLTRNLQR